MALRYLNQATVFQFGLSLALLAFAASHAWAQLAPARWHVTPAGFGPVRIGMTQSQVKDALGSDLLSEPVAGEISLDCVETSPRGWAGLEFMFENGRMTRMTIRDPSRLTTPRGIGAGTSELEVRRAYSPTLKTEPHHYENSPAKYLTYWTSRNLRGVRFEIGSTGRVEVIHAGSSSIEYVEGCL